jgi:hypothetical protein
MGLSAGAGGHGQARSKAGFDQARCRLISIIHHVRNCDGRHKKTARFRIL